MRKKSTMQIITSQNKLVHTLTKIGKITALGVCQNSVGLEYIFLSYSNFSGVKNMNNNKPRKKSLLDPIYLVNSLLCE